MASDAVAQGLLRALDANANRAREGIRTAEDYIRFALGSGPWAESLRGWRRRITGIVEPLFAEDRLVEARRVLADVGHPGRLGAEEAGAVGPEQAAVRGLKRAQEAVRVLEEHLWARSGKAALELRKVRFGLYQAEQWLRCGGENIARLRRARVYVLVTEALCRRGLERTVRGALKGGAGAVQMREKALPDRKLLARARRLGEWCEEHRALFVVNDRADVALVSGAGGVHLGQEDLSPAEVRAFAGEGLVLGRSVHGAGEAREAVKEGAGYLAAGAMYPTATKPEAESGGPERARAVIRAAGGLPVFAVGGVTAARAGELRKFGVRRVAVSRAVLGAEDAEQAVRRILRALGPAE